VSRKIGQLKTSFRAKKYKLSENIGQLVIFCHQLILPENERGRSKGVQIVLTPFMDSKAD